MELISQRKKIEQAVDRSVSKAVAELRGSVAAALPQVSDGEGVTIVIQNITVNVAVGESVHDRVTINQSGA